MALTKSGFKTNLVSFWRQNCRRRGEEEKREEEKRKRKKRRARRKNQDQRYGTLDLCMELTLGMNSCMNFHTIAWLFVVPKPRVC